MAYTFQQALLAFNHDRIRELSSDGDGRRFLKLRSLARKPMMERLAQEHGMTFPRASGNELFRVLYESGLQEQQIEHTIRNIYEEERQGRRLHEPELLDIFPK